MDSTYKKNKHGHRTNETPRVPNYNFSHDESSNKDDSRYTLDIRHSVVSLNTNSTNPLTATSKKSRIELEIRGQKQQPRSEKADFLILSDIPSTNLKDFVSHAPHPVKQQNQPHLTKAGSDRNLVREKSGGSTYSNTDSTAAFVKEDYRERDKMKVRLPDLVRQFSAEVLGTFLLVLFGDGAIAQVVLGGSFFGNFQSIMFGYGFALMIGILVSGGVSGGHLNPAVTLAMAVLRKCSWIQVPIYMLAQYLGAFLAAAVLYGIYADGINAHDGKVDGTAGIFASYPHSDGWDPSSVTLAFDQILGTALLLIIILAVTDERNMNVPSGLVPLLIGLGLAAIHNSFGLNAGSAINPARDFSPRLLTLMAGWSSGKTFGETNNYFFWIPWLLPHIGGVLGALCYQFMIAIHHPTE